MVAVGVWVSRAFVVTVVGVVGVGSVGRSNAAAVRRVFASGVRVVEQIRSC